MLRFKGDQEEIPREKASTLQIGSVVFPLEEYTSPQPHPCHRLFNQGRHQDRSSASLMKDAVTKVIDTLTQEDFHGSFQKLLELLQPEEITSQGTRVSFVYYQ